MAPQRFVPPFPPPRRKPIRSLLVLSLLLIVAGSASVISLRKSRNRPHAPPPWLRTDSSRASGTAEFRNGAVSIVRARAAGHWQAVVARDLQALLSGYRSDATVTIERADGTLEHLAGLDRIAGFWAPMLRGMASAGSSIVEAPVSDEVLGAQARIALAYRDGNSSAMSDEVRFDELGFIAEERIVVLPVAATHEPSPSAAATEGLPSVLPERRGGE